MSMMDDHQLDSPFRDFPFRVLWSGRCVAGFSEVSPLPQKMVIADTIQSGYPPPALGPEGQRTPFFINLDRGVSLDLSFVQWLSMVRSFGPATGKGSLLVEYKRPVIVEVDDGKGGTACMYHLFQCWVSEYRAVPDPDAGSPRTAIEHLRLGFGSFERDPPEV